MRDAGLDEAQLKLRLLEEIPITSEMQMTPSLCQKVKRNLMKVKEWKEWLKTQLSENGDHGICSHHFKANKWGNNADSERDFIFSGSKNSANGDCSHEI